MDRPSFWGDLVAIITMDFGRSTRDALWSLKDPGPALTEVGHALQICIASHCKARVKKVLPAQVLKWLRTLLQGLLFTSWKD